jgi:hypothetical protein
MSTRAGQRNKRQEDQPNYRYVITVDRGDPAKRASTQGHLRRDDARLAYSCRILEARKQFRMLNDPLPRLDSRFDRRAGVLYATKVGPEIITLRRRYPSDVDILPPRAWVTARASEPLGTKIKDGAQALLGFCLYIGFLGAFAYGSYWLFYDSDHGFKTKGECNSALFKYQYSAGHHGEECLELENGHWWIFDLDGNAL